MIGTVLQAQSANEGAAVIMVPISIILAIFYLYKTTSSNYQYSKLNRQLADLREFGIENARQQKRMKEIFDRENLPYPKSKKSKKKTTDRSKSISKPRKKSKPKVKNKPSSRSSDRPDASTKVDRGGSYDSRRTRPSRMSFDDKDDEHTEDLPDPNEIF